MLLSKHLNGTNSFMLCIINISPLTSCVSPKSSTITQGFGLGMLMWSWHIIFQLMNHALASPETAIRFCLSLQGQIQPFKKVGYPTQDKGGVQTICPHSTALIGYKKKKRVVPTPRPP